MTIQTLTAVIYARVSTEEQTKGYSLQTQEESCRRFCADHGYEIVGSFKDAHSGRELDRPGLTAAIEAVDTLKPDVIVLHDVDRLGREIIVQAIAERDLTRHGARIEYVLGGGNATPEQELLKMVKQGIAVYENRQRVERSRRGKEGRIKAGYPVVAARPAYGYQYFGGKRTGALEPHPDEAPIVRRIFEWCANDGLTTYEIAKRLHAEGVPTRGDSDPVVYKRTDHHFWDPSTVARIIRNETHKGVWYWRKTKKVLRGDKRVQVPRPREEWLSINITPIVDEDLWTRAQEQLDRNKANASRNAKREYLLRGLVFCPSCGRRWVGRYKNHLKRAYYRCPTTEGEPWRQDCKARFGLEQQKLETAVLQAVKSFLLDPETRAAGVAAEQNRQGLERERLKADVTTIERRFAEVEKKLGALLDQALTDGFPADMIERRKRDLIAEREMITRERDAAHARLTSAGPLNVEAAIAELAPTVEQAFEHATTAEMRRLLELLRIAVYPVDRNSIRLTGVIAASSGSVLTLSSGRNSPEN